MLLGLWFNHLLETHTRLHLTFAVLCERLFSGRGDCTLREEVPGHQHKVPEQIRGAGRKTATEFVAKARAKGTKTGAAVKEE